MRFTTYLEAAWVTLEISTLRTSLSDKCTEHFPKKSGLLTFLDGFEVGHDVTFLFDLSVSNVSFLDSKSTSLKNKFVLTYISKTVHVKFRNPNCGWLSFANLLWPSDTRPWNVMPKHIFLPAFSLRIFFSVCSTSTNLICNLRKSKIPLINEVERRMNIFYLWKFSKLISGLSWARQATVVYVFVTYQSY